MQAQSDYLLAQLNLAICKFEEGVTYEPKSSDRLKTLADAVSEFETIHVKNRTLSAVRRPCCGRESASRNKETRKRRWASTTNWRSRSLTTKRPAISAIRPSNFASRASTSNPARMRRW